MLLERWKPGHATAWPVSKRLAQATWSAHDLWAADLLDRRARQAGIRDLQPHMFPHTSGVLTGGRLAEVQLLSEGDEVAHLAKLHSGSSDQQNPGLLED